MLRKNENYFVATDLLENFVKDVEWSDIKVLGNLSGAEFEKIARENNIDLNFRFGQRAISIRNACAGRGGYLITDKQKKKQQCKAFSQIAYFDSHKQSF